VGLVLGSAALAAGDASRWVERTKADVRAGRGSYYEVVDTVLRGEQVQVLASEARWLSIRTPRARTGWIFEGALAVAPVTPGTAAFLKLVPGDASTSATAASTGAKGVYAQDYARQRGYDYGVVEWIEHNQPAAAEVEAFVREGELRAPGVQP
jgi:uncharacterized protein YgiM (DUF1202 family)